MPIKMKALRSFGYPGANEGHVRRSREFEVRDERRCKDLETEGLAYRLAVKAEPQNKIIESQDVIAASEPNKAAEAGPFGLAGGRIGAEEPAQSSPPAARRRRQRSKVSRGGYQS